MSQANTFSTGLNPSSNGTKVLSGEINSGSSVSQLDKFSSKPDSGPNWRMGKFHDDKDEDQYYTEQGNVSDHAILQIKAQDAKQSKHA